jgi:uncharacterized protein (DUF433 family)
MSTMIEAQRVFEELGQLREEIQRLGDRVERLVVGWERPSLSTEHPHVISSEKMHRGEPTIRGTAITVRTVVERTRLGDSIQEIVEAYPVLTPAQVCDALGYYYDHTDEIEQYITENREAAWRMSKRRSS